MKNAGSTLSREESDWGSDSGPRGITASIHKQLAAFPPLDFWVLTDPAGSEPVAETAGGALDVIRPAAPDTIDLMDPATLVNGRCNNFCPLCQTQALRYNQTFKTAFEMLRDDGASVSMIVGSIALLWNQVHGLAGPDIVNESELRVHVARELMTNPDYVCRMTIRITSIEALAQSQNLHEVVDKGDVKESQLSESAVKKLNMLAQTIKTLKQADAVIRK